MLLYGAETWRLKKTTLKRIQTFVNQCLRKIIGNTADGQSQQQGPLGENQPSSNRGESPITSAITRRGTLRASERGGDRKTPGDVTLTHKSRKRG